MTIDAKQKAGTRTRPRRGTGTRSVPSAAESRRAERPGRGRPTADRILDAAEKLFARRGFHGVSVRDITQEAGVDVALVNYHFGSKQALLDHVLTRRSVPLNAERMQRLEACLARAGTAPPDIEEVIDAFTHPLLDRSARGGPGWKAFFALIAQVNNSPEFGGVVMTRYFDPVVGVFVEALRRALPDCDPREVFWSYQFLSGALTLTFAETGRIDNLSGGLCRSSDLDSVHERLVPFVAAGFRELCARSEAQRRRRGPRSPRRQREDRSAG
ncbi:MAG: TetR family transcriptional regulator [Steroidobacteraceae bacterium]